MRSKILRSQANLVFTYFVIIDTLKRRLEMTFDTDSKCSNVDLGLDLNIINPPEFLRSTAF
jgi:hypothetical protein